jgi:hypothetical protein
MAYRTNLGGNDATFQGMMENGFGIVTVMNAKIFDALSVDELKKLTAYDIVTAYKDSEDYLCKLDTLKIANVTQEGPTKSVTGGQFSNPLIKFGKSARLEMQDALGNSKAIEYLCGGFQEWNTNEALVGLHFGEDFVGPKMIIGDSFFIDRKSGRQVPVIIVFYQFLPDSIFNLTQDAEGDATVFDMNGDLLTTVIKVGSVGTHGVFYSIVDPNETSTTKIIRSFKNDDEVKAAAETLNPGATIKVNGVEKTIATITEALDSANKLVYTVAYVGDEDEGDEGDEGDDNQ